MQRNKDKLTPAHRGQKQALIRPTRVFKSSAWRLLGHDSETVSGVKKKKKSYTVISLHVQLCAKQESKDLNSVSFLLLFFYILFVDL